MKKRFLTGLVVILPLVITLWIVVAIVKMVTKPFTFWTKEILSQTQIFQEGFLIFSHEQMLQVITICAILVGVLVSLFLIGYLSRWVFIHFLWKGIERFILSLPLVNRVYRACRDFTKVLFSPSGSSFTRVVWFPFPNPKQKALALVTNEMLLMTASDEMPQEYVSVFLPGTPNPTVGFLLICPKKNVVPTDIRVDSAMKWVISCGSSKAESIIKSFVR